MIQPLPAAAGHGSVWWMFLEVQTRTRKPRRKFRHGLWRVIAHYETDDGRTFRLESPPMHWTDARRCHQHLLACSQATDTTWSDASRTPRIPPGVVLMPVLDDVPPVKCPTSENVGHLPAPIQESLL